MNVVRYFSDKFSVLFLNNCTMFHWQNNITLVNGDEVIDIKIEFVSIKIWRKILKVMSEKAGKNI